MTAEAAPGAPFVTRFAPSPTGFLHKGHAYSALTAWTAAQAAGGRFVLRIEDTDFTRCRPEFEAAIYDDLAWLGLDWERPVRRQSEHRLEYAAALRRLERMGVLYRCFRTRKEILAAAAGAPHADDPADALAFTGGPLPGPEERARMESGQAFAWRLSLDRARACVGAFDRLTWLEETPDGLVERPARPERLGDMVIGRKDIGAGYLIASVLDDALQGVTHVIRGEDLRDVTSVQRLVQALLDLPTPTYRHHPLVLGPDGRRLAKRDQAETLTDVRARGVSAADVRAELGF